MKIKKSKKQANKLRAYGLDAHGDQRIFFRSALPHREAFPGSGACGPRFRIGQGAKLKQMSSSQMTNPGHRAE
ncbi:AAEL017047-PA [Aedes aegypti]|uniref:AAEL017047-PA n=1 Tax=Aedes aegypti TaxID=7159 RepID=J9HRZ4_AEDAE|nr:AAEL017047-PA [Aedes aegypti]